MLISVGKTPIKLEPQTFANSSGAAQRLSVFIHDCIWKHYHGTLHTRVDCEIEVQVKDADNDIGSLVVRLLKPGIVGKEIQLTYKVTPKEIEYYDAGNNRISQFKSIARQLKDAIET